MADDKIKAIKEILDRPDEIAEIQCAPITKPLEFYCDKSEDKNINCDSQIGAQKNEDQSEISSKFSVSVKADSRD